MTIEDAAKATRKHDYTWSEALGRYAVVVVSDTTRIPLSVHETEDEAQDACDMLNLNAVLKELED